MALLCLRPSPLLGCALLQAPKRRGKGDFCEAGAQGELVLSPSPVPIALGKGLQPAGSWARLLEAQHLGLRGWDSCPSPPFAPKRHQTKPEHSCFGFFFKVWVKSWYYRAYTCVHSSALGCLSPDPRLIPLLCAPRRRGAPGPVLLLRASGLVRMRLTSQTPLCGHPNARIPARAHFCVLVGPPQAVGMCARGGAQSRAAAALGRSRKG